MLGLYVSDHPLFGVEHVLPRRPTARSPRSPRRGVTTGRSSARRDPLRRPAAVTKQGKAWASATLEDLDGAVEVLFFPNTYELVGPYIAEDAIVVVKGRVDRARTAAADGDGHVAAGDHRRGRVKPVVARPCPRRAARRRWWSGSREVLTSHPGSAEVHLRLVNGGRPRCCGWRRRVAPTTALMADLKALLGPGTLAS